MQEFSQLGLLDILLEDLSLLKLAAAVANIIRTVVTLSTQKYGAVDTVSQLRQCCSILLIHGTMMMIYYGQAVHLVSIKSK